MPKKNNPENDQDFDLTIEDVESAMAEAEAIEAEKERKKQERLEKKRQRELKKKREQQMKLVAPLLLATSLLISFGLYLLGRLGG